VSYSVFIAFSTSDDARAALVAGIGQGFALSGLPSGVFVAEEITSVERQAYVHVHENRLLYNTIYLHNGVKSMDIVSISLADWEDNDYRRLTNTAVAEVQPALCPGNQKIAFVQIRGYHVEEEPNWAIWVMDSDGQHMQPLIDEAEVVYDKPVWSADCRYIAYAALDQKVELQRWVITLLDYTNPSAAPIQLTPGRYPSLVPGGSPLELAFESKGALYRLDVDACLENMNQGLCEAVPLTGEKLAGTHPAISPDGRWLAFASIPTLDETSGSYSQDIYLCDLVQAGGCFPVAANPNLDWRPVWGPDSETLYFESGRTPYFSIFAVSMDGFFLHLLTDPNVEDQNPQVVFQDAYFPLDVGDSAAQE
jgi:Tol biopolymer transport system component